MIQAIQLYERAGSEQAIDGLTITEAKEKYGIVKAKTNSSPGPSSGKSSGQTGRRRSASRQADGDTGESHDLQEDSEPGDEADNRDEEDIDGSEQPDGGGDVLHVSTPDWVTKALLAREQFAGESRERLLRQGRACQTIRTRK